MEELSDNDRRKVVKLLDETEGWLLQLESKKRSNVLQEMVKNPHYNESDVYILCLKEYQTQKSDCPPEPKKRSSTTEGNNMVKKKSERRMGPKRPREKEEKCREKKKRVEKNNKKVNPVVLPEKPRNLPAEIKDRIKELKGSDVIMVMEKNLYKTDVKTGNGRLSLPSRQIDMRFLTEEEKVFLATREDGSKVLRIKSTIIGEGGTEHEIWLCKWDMAKTKKVSAIYNLLSGWNDVLKAHELRGDKLCRHTVVQLWSFRVEGNLWFALVRVSITLDCDCELYP